MRQETHDTQIKGPSSLPQTSASLRTTIALNHPTSPTTHNMFAVSTLWSNGNE